MPTPIPSNERPTLKPGEWWLKYTGDVPIRFRSESAPDITTTLRPNEAIVMDESDALRLLAYVQKQRPDILRRIVILDREPEGGVRYVERILAEERRRPKLSSTT